MTNTIIIDENLNRDSAARGVSSNIIVSDEEWEKLKGSLWGSDEWNKILKKSVSTGVEKIFLVIK